MPVSYSGSKGSYTARRNSRGQALPSAGKICIPNSGRGGAFANKSKQALRVLLLEIEVLTKGHADMRSEPQKHSNRRHSVDHG